MVASASSARTRSSSCAPARHSRGSRACGGPASAALTPCSPNPIPRSEAVPITSVTSDPEALSLTIVGDYLVPIGRLWEAWADPRQLEKFWGPEGWPATFTRHDMTVGGRAEYHMTGPDGSTAHGWWRFVAVEPSRRFAIEDGFADKSGRPDATMPTTRMTVTFEST